MALKGVGGCQNCFTFLSLLFSSASVTKYRIKKRQKSRAGPFKLQLFLAHPFLMCLQKLLRIIQPTSALDMKNELFCWDPPLDPIIPAGFRPLSWPCTYYSRWTTAHFPHELGAACPAEDSLKTPPGTPAVHKSSQNHGETDVTLPAAL